MKELTFLQIENGKSNLIKLKNDLIERFKKNDRRKKPDRDYYEYEENKFYGLKDIRNLFNENGDDDNYEGTEYLFDESIMYYFEYEEINCFELVNDEKVEYCTIIEDRKVESYELIEEKYAEIIECELIEDQEDINELNEYLEIIFNKIVEITFNESPFKSLISDIRSILHKDGCENLKKRLKHIRELRKSTTFEIKNIKNELIKIENKRRNRNKKEVKDYYQVKNYKFYGVKDIRNVFDDDDDDDIYQRIKYLFDEKIIYFYFKQKSDEIIKNQKVEDIKMPK